MRESERQCVFQCQCVFPLSGCLQARPCLCRWFVLGQTAQGWLIRTVTHAHFLFSRLACSQLKFPHLSSFWHLSLLFLLFSPFVAHLQQILHFFFMTYCIMTALALNYHLQCSPLDHKGALWISITEPDLLTSVWNYKGRFWTRRKLLHVSVSHARVLLKC